MGKKANRGSFSSTNQPSKRRGKSKRNQLLNVLEQRGWTEGELWDSVLDMAMDGDSAALNAFLNRLSPVSRPTLPKLNVELDERFFELSHAAKLDFLVWLSLRGLISSDVASTIAGMISNTSTVTSDEITRMRVNSLREFQGSDDDGFPASEEYRLLQQLRDDNKRDSELLASMVRDSGDNAHIVSDDQDATSELTSVSLHDVVQAQENANTNANTGDDGSDE